MWHLLIGDKGKHIEYTDPRVAKAVAGAFVSRDVPRLGSKERSLDQLDLSRLETYDILLAGVRRLKVALGAHLEAM